MMETSEPGVAPKKDGDVAMDWLGKKGDAYSKGKGKGKGAGKGEVAAPKAKAKVKAKAKGQPRVPFTPEQKKHSGANSGLKGIAKMGMNASSDIWACPDRPC